MKKVAYGLIAIFAIIVTICVVVLFNTLNGINYEISADKVNTPSMEFLAKAAKKTADPHIALPHFSFLLYQTF